MPGTGPSSAYGVFLVVQGVCKAEVAETPVEVGVEHYVAGLDVFVDYFEFARSVEVM